ncbi:hypothetical protein [uncultured Kocuria sp.]|uniref:hypothetical protein n=1 Tax=uncultured Kocuria sp. TaxID=259305 RepID=UPI002626DD22|nr:hypothetical protein [uncultured Kocuria sp.]
MLAKTDCNPMVFATTLKKFDFLASLRDVGITFIGGKRDPDVLKTLSSLLGVTPRDVRWIESEKNKSPTNIDATLPDKDSKRVVVMVTGAIGHSTSIPTKALAKKRNFRLIETEQARHTMVALQEFAG